MNADDTNTPDAEETEWAPPGGWPEVSDRAKKVIDSLRNHPGLLREVALHFEHGWPTADLIEPWTVGSHHGVPALARLTYQELVREANEATERHPVALILPLIGDGFDGSQWVAAAFDPEDPKKLLHRRVRDSILDALTWCDEALLAHDPELVLSPLSDTGRKKLLIEHTNVLNQYAEHILNARKLEAFLRGQIEQLRNKAEVTEAEINHLKQTLRKAGVTDCQIEEITKDINVVEDEVPF